MGGRAYGVAVAGPLAVDGVRFKKWARNKKGERV